MESAYAQFNFLLDLAGDAKGAVDAGFQECSELNQDKADSVTFKRGVMKHLSFAELINERGPRSVRVILQNEDRSAREQAWRLHNARLVKYVGGPRNAKGTDVAMEELVLAYERLDTE